MNRLLDPPQQRLTEREPLCGHHHALKTRDAWRVVEQDSVTRMEPP
jgi:hypothetical protein